MQNPLEISARQIAGWLLEAKRGVAFTGAGISTESGIPDFRSPGGVWSQNRQVQFQEFLDDPEARFEYWRQKSIAHGDFEQAQPNITHQSLAEWEHAGYLRGVITQNIDGLHQDAGSENVLELHGTARFIACLKCGTRTPADNWVRLFQETQIVPDCPECAGLLKHATISFGQMLDREVLYQAGSWANEADLFLVLGSSLVVEPAASLPVLAKRNANARVVILNRDYTTHDGLADLVVNAPLGEIMPAIRACISEITGDTDKNGEQE